MLIDFHAHSSGISHCCRIPVDEVIKTAIDHCIDGIVLTNHYQKCYVKEDNASDFAKRYIEEYRFAQKCAEAQNDYPVFFGIEVTMEKHSGAHLLIYGVDETFVEKYPNMYDETQENLYRNVEGNYNLGLFDSAAEYYK